MSARAADVTMAARALVVVVVCVFADRRIRGGRKASRNRQTNVTMFNHITRAIACMRVPTHATTTDVVVVPTVALAMIVMALARVVAATFVAIMVVVPMVAADVVATVASLVAVASGVASSALASFVGTTIAPGVVCVKESIVVAAPSANSAGHNASRGGRRRPSQRRQCPRHRQLRAPGGVCAPT